jgi:hypothetical protein
VAPQRDPDVGSEGSDKDGSTYGEFVDSDYEFHDDDDDLFYDDVDDGVVDEGAAKGIMLGKGKKRNAHMTKRTCQQIGNGMSCHLMRMSWSYQILMKRVRLGGI